MDDLNLGPRRGQPRIGGTIEHPGNLYPPGVGTCTVCGTDRLPTYGGRLQSHSGGLLPGSGPAQPWSPPDGDVARYRLTMCRGSWRPVMQP